MPIPKKLNFAPAAFLLLLGCAQMAEVTSQNPEGYAAHKYIVDASPIENLNANQQFVRKAALGSEFEIVSSKLALSRSRDNEVRNFARQMIRDHSDAAEALGHTAYASKLSNSLNAGAALAPKHENLLKKLEAANDDFDKRYAEAQVTAHDETVSLFSGYAKSGKDKGLKKYAKETLPILKNHQKHAKRLRDGLR